MKKPSVVPAGVRVDGELEGEGDLVVRGHVEGPVRVGGALLIDEGGIVRGHVHAESVTIRGALKGDAFADESIRVEQTGRLVGDLTAPRVRVIPGAKFAGQVHVQALEVAPPLRTYDPALHTFTGLPAPGPISDELAAGVSLVRAPAPMAADTLAEPPPRMEEPMAGDTLAEPPPEPPKPPKRRRKRPSRAAGVMPREERVALHRGIEESRPAEAAPSAETRESDTPRPKPPSTPPLRMPRVGRVRGAHRSPGSSG